MCYHAVFLKNKAIIRLSSGVFCKMVSILYFNFFFYWFFIRTHDKTQALERKNYESNIAKNNKKSTYKLATI